MYSYVCSQHNLIQEQAYTYDKKSNCLHEGVHKSIHNLMPKFAVHTIFPCYTLIIAAICFPSHFPLAMRIFNA